MRTLWILWCLGWAAVWFLSGFVNFIGFFIWPLALFAIALPIGTTPQVVVQNINTNRES